MTTPPKNTSDKRSCYLFPKILGDCIEPLTRPVFKAHGLAGSRVLTEWESIAGAALSKHSMPEKLAFSKGKKTAGTLTICVENGFATELHYMQPMILERLAGYFGYQAVDRIVISHSWVPVKPVSQPEVSGLCTLPPIDPLIADDVTDPELREALHSFARTLAGEIR